MHLFELRNQCGLRLSHKEELQIVMDMRPFAPARLTGNVMAIDQERAVLAAMPRMQGETLEAGFLNRLTQGRMPELCRRLVMTAWLKPAPEGLVVDEQRAITFWRQDDRACGHVPWIGIAAVKGVPLVHLPAQQREQFIAIAVNLQIPGDQLASTVGKCWISHEGSCRDAARQQA